ncbi:TPA: hypothetical protein HMV82_16150 [Escherichia coli]|nr:hypothetical protein [Escherichia coli]TRL65868.1 hypothetical protein FMM65_18220 [Citrobacter youngae]HAJ5984332.1 hypothetical protein [Escherichia coli]
MDSVHHIWCPLSSQEFQDLPDGAETTLTVGSSVNCFIRNKLPQFQDANFRFFGKWHYACFTDSNQLQHLD